MTKQHVKKQPTPAMAINSDRTAAEANYRALFEYAPDGILVADSEGCYLDANPSMCSMLGYTRDELIGMYATEIVVDTEVPYIEPALTAIKSKADYSREWLLRRKDGSVFSADIIATTMPDGNILAMVRDITILKQQQSEISKLTHLHAALTRVNQSIIWLPDKVQLFNTLCHILVEEAGFKMAWVAWHNAKTKQLEPVAVWGDDDGYISSIRIYSDDRPEGQGPTGQAFRTEQPYICNNMQDDPATLIWREEIVRRGFKACAAFPIRARSAVCGTLSVYADQLVRPEFPKHFSDSQSKVCQFH